MGDTSIEWTDKVWNPVSGCTKVSQGCKNCYAERVANRWWGDRKFTDVQIHPERLNQPLKWRKPSRIFVNSMSDLFHEDVPASFIDQVFATMSIAYTHTFQILTKRPDGINFPRMVDRS
jgi:protein gp37